MNPSDELTLGSVLRFAVGTVISLGSAAAISYAFKDTIRSAKGIAKISMRLGIFVVGCKIGEDAETFFNKTVDETVETCKEIFKHFKTRKKR